MPETFPTNQLAPASGSSVGKGSLALKKAQACGGWGLTQDSKACVNPGFQHIL